DRIVRRTDATSCHQLDLTGALSQLLARAQPHLIGAVGDGCDAGDLRLAQRPAKGPRNFVARPKISVARGLRANYTRGLYDADVGARPGQRRVSRNLLDDVAPHEHAGRRRQRGVLAIEDADILKKRRPGSRQSGGGLLGPELQRFILREARLAKPE